MDHKRKEQKGTKREEGGRLLNEGKRDREDKKEGGSQGWPPGWFVILRY
jgi:hypothetical protein